jgi:lysophospholipase L1-like esterase
MQALAVTFANAAIGELERWAGHWQEGPWFETFRALVHRAGAKLVVVHVPMRQAYRRAVNDTALWTSYETWLRADLASQGDFYVDLSRSLDDALLEDGVHANAEGARVFSKALANAIGPYVYGPTRRESPGD